MLEEKKKKKNKEPLCKGRLFSFRKPEERGRYNIIPYFLHDDTESSRSFFASFRAAVIATGKTRVSSSPGAAHR